ncbi:MAG: 1-acyl-sn-glycerol-3-phosphate acyltransferase, partial [Proteobacteria bacterium]
PGRADFSIGPAIVPQEGEDAIALMARVEKWIEDEMRVIDADAYGEVASKAA